MSIKSCPNLTLVLKEQRLGSKEGFGGLVAGSSTVAQTTLLVLSPSTRQNRLFRTRTSIQNGRAKTLLPTRQSTFTNSPFSSTAAVSQADYYPMSLCLLLLTFPGGGSFKNHEPFHFLSPFPPAPSPPRACLGKRLARIPGCLVGICF